MLIIKQISSLVGDKNWKTFPVKSQIVNILCFVGCPASVATTQLSH